MKLGKVFNGLLSIKESLWAIAQEMAHGYDIVNAGAWFPQVINRDVTDFINAHLRVCEAKAQGRFRAAERLLAIGREELKDIDPGILKMATHSLGVEENEIRGLYLEFRENGYVK